MKQGIALSVASSGLFAVLYYYSTILPPVTGTEIFAWRVLLALPFLALLISRGRAWGEVVRCARRARTQWRYGAALVVSAALLGVQLWLFTWAPLHRKALDVSLGYFLLPLCMVVVGRFFYGERLSRVQWLAVAAAAAGVVHEVLRLGTFSWATALVMFGYPPYFMLRRKIRLGSLAGLWCDMLLLAPPALLVIATQQPSLWHQLATAPRLLGLIPLLGGLSSVALVCYLSASRMLPLALFGILGYVEPVLLFWVAFLFLGEPMAADAWWTYIPIWVAVLLIAGEGALLWLREARRAGLRQ
ncbi:EamA family transporter RarD [Candidimonas humi]|uniref:EamA family transporter RarD n=1 Tax=Candidimonas humi TaxID=683355 RepID=A0ABV8NVS4_9BURK|nr:EamA family transporter RarD [Candidimonas humi]MBV6305252.1 EamA family transporter RarD [Candidimonas humi]